jgi:pimeloyl-ACP methyl ester carboxylesterase
MTDHPVARRTVIKSAGLGIGAGLASGITSAHAQTAAQAQPAEIWSGEYWAHKGNVKLAMFRKRLTAPAANGPPQPVLFLVHGSSNAARSSYDLTVPGKGEYSMMNVFARYGYDVWTMDHDGCGNSDSSGNNSDIASGVEDLKAAMPVVTQETGQQRIHFYGTSSGGIRAAAYAQARPEHVDRLVLCAFTYRGEGAAEEHRGAARQSAAQARRQHDPLDLHPRRASGNLRSRGAGSDHCRRDDVRRHHSERHLSRHGGEPAGGRSDKGDVPGADGARRMGRQFDQRRPARLLSSIAERRPPVRHPAADRA